MKEITAYVTFKVTPADGCNPFSFDCETVIPAREWEDFRTDNFETHVDRFSHDIERQVELFDGDKLEIVKVDYYC